jgi:hypothetical protein
LRKYAFVRNARRHPPLCDKQPVESSSFHDTAASKAEFSPVISHCHRKSVSFVQARSTDCESLQQYLPAGVPAPQTLGLILEMIQSEFEVVNKDH